MAKERAARRAERERLAAEAAAAREAEAAKAARRAARRQRLFGWVPRPHPQQSGALAARRRQQLWMTFAVVVALNVVAYFFDGSFGFQMFVLVASLLGAPVFYTLMFRKS